MSKKTLLLFAFALVSFWMHAQQYNWVQRIGNSKSDKVITTKTDAQGFIYISGYFSTNIAIGTNAVYLNYTGSASSKEAFVAKLDSTGFCYWAHSGGNGFDDRVLGMDVDSAGNVIIVGTYWSNNFNFPPIMVNNTGFGGSDQCFVVRLNTNGVPQWGTFVAGNSGDDQGLDVAFDKNGNAYIVGFMSGDLLRCGGNVVTASNTNTLYQQHSYWLAKINAAGTFQWAKCFGNLPFDTAASKYIERDIAVCTDGKDGVFIGGGFDHTWPFGNTTLTSAGGYDIFAMKYDTSGNFHWAKRGGSDKDDWVNGICSDKKGNIYLTGEHRDSLIVDTVLIKNYNKRDVFVLKMDAATGSALWGKRAGSNLGGERGNDVWADSNCNVYVCGDINDGAKFGDDIIVSTGNMEQSFVARISPEGKWSWVVTGGCPDSNDRGNTVVKGLGSQVYTGGYFNNTGTYGSQSVSSAGKSDGFFARIHDSMVNVSTKFSFPPIHKTALCFGDTLVYKFPDHGYFYMTPTTGVTFNSDSTKLTFAPTTTTTYTLFAQSEGSCPEYDTISFTLNVSNLGFAFSSMSDTAICDGESLQFPIPPHDNFSIMPTIGATVNSTQTEITFAPLTTTTYTLTGGVGGVCPVNDIYVVTIIAAPQPGAAFLVTPGVALLDNPKFTLTNTTIGNNQYSWYRSNILFTTAKDAQYTESDTGLFCYTLVAESLYGCIDSTSNCGRVIDDESILFPNAFSPNNDGRNDEFMPIFVNVDIPNLKEYSFSIINRYGQVIYQSTNPRFGWDGTFKGGQCDVGTYFYLCTVKNKKDKSFTFKGDVTLLR
jgi:gliding motility-associated-like protein